jgi:uncharacterized Ntn-hydrolase superfamily protein
MKFSIQCILIALILLVFSIAQDHRPISTYSIVAYDETTGELGVAVQSHWFSVGALVPWAKSGVGAVATQSFVRVEYGPEGLELMSKGHSAKETLDFLVSQDEGRDVRQVAMVDVNGSVAIHTGKNCIAEAGHYQGKNFAVQANIMENPTVWGAMAKAFETSSGDLADRMMAALEAAQAEGGDLRGRQSAALLVVKGTPEENPWDNKLFDLRIEDHPEPLKELKRLIRINRAYIHANNGDLYLEEGMTKEALDEYSKAANYYPENPELPFWTAVTLAGSGKLDTALPIFADVFAKDPKLRILVKRLVPAGILPDDKDLIDKRLKQ